MFLLLINFKSKFCNFHSCIGIPDYRCLAFPQWIFKMKVFIFLIRMKVFHLTVLTSCVFIKVNLLILSLWYIFSCCVIGTLLQCQNLPSIGIKYQNWSCFCERMSTMILKTLLPTTSSKFFLVPKTGKYSVTGVWKERKESYMLFWDQSFLKSSFAWAQYGTMVSSDSNTSSWKLLVVTHISHIFRC